MVKINNENYEWVKYEAEIHGLNPCEKCLGCSDEFYEIAGECRTSSDWWGIKEIFLKIKIK